MKLILFILLFTCNTKNSMFLDKIVNNFDRNSYFIAIDVKSAEYNGRVIIENDDLYYYYEQKKQYSKSIYKDFIIQKLLANESLNINATDFEKWNFYKVPSIISITQNEEKGVEGFIKTYFDGRVLKDGITDEERIAIINQLFEWEIASYIDDETGYLVIKK